MNKSLFRRPGTKHFQLVHRSLRDPLINDPDASPHVLKSLDAPQSSKHRNTASEAASSAGDFEYEEGQGEAGDAASYGVFFDDTEYDYMQHLRSVGSASDAFLVEQPVTAKGNKGKGKAKEFTILPPTNELLPDEVLPTHPLDEVSYSKATEKYASSGVTGGLQPDMDPKIREVLEALDDDAYAEGEEGEDEEDAFWGEVVRGGELGEGEEADWEDEEESGAGGAKVREGWEAFDKFRAEQKAAGGSEDGSDEEVDSDFGSEGGDTIAALRQSSARRPPRRGMSAAGSQFSMTSSAMFRNEGLRTLDDRFDEIEKMYEDDSDSSWGGHSDEDDDVVHEAIPAREDLTQIMDDFLSRYEVLGGKMRHVLEGETPAGKLEKIRRELASLDIEGGEEGETPEEAARRKEKESILEAVERQLREEEKGGGKIPMPEEKMKDRWDCETVLSTYSNVSNHPRMLRMRDLKEKKPAKIEIDEKTGFPLVDGEHMGPKKRNRRHDAIEEEDEDEEMEEVEIRETVTRPRGESAEQKKARKAAVKQERAERRNEKKATKEAFGAEVKRQKKIAGRKVAGGGAADIRVGEGVRRLA
ncbi:low temperature viability protein [Pseudohyphozyma bogoriensis]|nr:low temperature viability protein [Pseudohyphozyma bogoriensis]